MIEGNGSPGRAAASCGPPRTGHSGMAGELSWQCCDYAENGGATDTVKIATEQNLHPHGKAPR